MFSVSKNKKLFSKIVTKHVLNYSEMKMQARKIIKKTEGERDRHLPC